MRQGGAITAASLERDIRRYALGAAILVAMGVLIWTGELFALDIQAQRLIDHLGLDFLTSV